MRQSGVAVDTHFAVTRLAKIYDALDPDRSDLDAYLAMVDEFGASSVLDIGSCTGTFASLLAQRGKTVLGVDPASASVEVARRKPGGDHVRWLVGDAAAIPELQGDMVTMTGNVAQVFVTDQDWAATLAAARTALRPGGRLVFETRDPAKEVWRDWTREQTHKQVDIPGVGGVESWVDLTMVRLPLVSFRTTFIFASDGAVLTSDSTLRFPERGEVGGSLGAVGLAAEDIRHAPDRPGLEMVFVATKAAFSSGPHELAHA